MAPARIRVALAALEALVLAGAVGAAVGLAHRDKPGFPDITPRVHGDFRPNPQWAGYAVHGHRYTSVSASWVVPRITCGGEDSNAAFWVGLDGILSRTVEQAGVEALCRDGQPRYGAWSQLYPAPSRPFDVAIVPGDRVRVAVRRQAGRIAIDLAVGPRTFHRDGAVPATGGTSAEIVAEQSGDRYGPLSAFGAVTFTDVRIDGRPLAVSAPYALAMLRTDGIFRARPSPIRSRDTFMVRWVHS